MSWLLLILLTLVIGVVTQWFIKYYKYEWYLKKYAGPSVLPLLGTVHHFRSFEDILPTTIKFWKKYGGVFKLFTGSRPMLIFTDLKGVEEILMSNSVLDKAYGYRMFQDWLGLGLFTNTGESWRKNRKMLTPAFHFQALEQFSDTFDKASNILVKKLSAEVGKDSVDIAQHLKLCTLDIICEAALGTTLNAQNDSESELVKGIEMQSKISIARAFSFVKSNQFLFKFTSDYKDHCESIKVIHDYTNDIIRRRKEQILEETISGAEEKSSVENDKKRKCFLDLLLYKQLDGQAVSDKMIRDEVNTIIFGGYDTTSSALAFTLLCLANHPEEQNKVVEELNEIFGSTNNNRPATPADLQQMKITEMVLKEAMRLYTPSPMIGRTVHDDIYFDGGVLPKGMSVTFFLHGIHRDAKNFPDPDRFDPERFSPENSKERPNHAYIPFGAGPRICIGQKFAMLKLKAILSKLLRHYEILPTIPEHKPKLYSSIILNSSNGVCIRLKKRQ